MTERTEDSKQEAETWVQPAVIGGGVSSVVFLAVALGVGTVGDRQALALLESTLPTIRFLCSSGIAAAATVLALMVTMLGLSLQMDFQMRPEYFERIRLIGTMCVTVMVGAVGLLLVLCVPLSEAEEVATWYTGIYYAVLITASLLGGGLVAITMALRKAIASLVSVAHPEADSSVLLREEG